MSEDIQADVELVGQIESVPTILEVVCRTTGMGFAAVARVTDERWIACSVLDELNFGVAPGGELKIETTICHEVHQCNQPIVIDHVAEDPEWRDHPTPAMYGFQSYISVPIILGDGSFFGTLCAIDPKPVRLRTPEITGMFRLFAELIAKHLDAMRKFAVTQSELLEERAVAELREYFIAVLGHDLRTPLRGIRSFTELLLRTPLENEASDIANMIRSSAIRMQGLIDKLLDLARGRLGGGLTLVKDPARGLEPVLHSVVAEVIAAHPDQILETKFTVCEPVNCDPARIGQLFANLLSNAFAYGSPGKPIRVNATSNSAFFELSVANAGEPIPGAALDRLFHPFYRNTIRQGREGLGLGLYIAHEVARAHGGTLTVKSTEEETCFTFHMPQTNEAH